MGEVMVLRRKEEEGERKRKELEATSDEWKRLHDEVVLKFDAKDVTELKRLKDEEVKWKAQRSDLLGRVEKLQDDSKQQKEDVASSQGLKARNEELLKAATEAKAKVDQLTKEKAQLQAES